MNKNPWGFFGNVFTEIKCRGRIAYLLLMIHVINIKRDHAARKLRETEERIQMLPSTDSKNIIGGNVAIQMNGKLLSSESAREMDRVFTGHTISGIVLIPDKLINIVTTKPTK